jgi:two-component system sensor histidine kinase AgrC
MIKMNFAILEPLTSLIIDIALLNIILHSKRKPAVTILLWFVISTAFIVFVHYFLGDLKQNRIIMYSVLSIFLFACFYLYENNFFQTTFAFFAVWTTSSMLANICLYVSHLYFNHLDLQSQNIVNLTLFILIYAIIIPLIKYKMVKDIRKVLDLFNKKFLIFLLLPILYFILFISMFNQYTTDVVTYQKFFVMLLFISIIGLSYYFMFFISNQLYAKSIIEEKLKASQIHHSMQKDHYVVLKKNIDKINMIHHDRKQHLISIQNLLVSEKFEELNNYIHRLISKEENIELSIICENSSNNAIISYYIDRAKKSDIKTSYQISIPENINIDSIDLNITFGNCLDNAIDACLKLDEKSQRFLNIKAAIVKHYFIIDIANSFDGIVHIKDGIISSTKLDGQNHGIGLDSVRTIVTQYNGTINYSYTNTEFRTSIMMFVGDTK